MCFFLLTIIYALNAHILKRKKNKNLTIYHNIYLCQFLKIQNFQFQCASFYGGPIGLKFFPHRFPNRCHNSVCVGGGG